MEKQFVSKNLSDSDSLLMSTTTIDYNINPKQKQISNKFTSIVSLYETSTYLPYVKNLLSNVFNFI